MIPEQLPPLPEEPPDGGVLDELGRGNAGTDVPEVVRTGAATQSEDVTMSRRTSEAEPEPQPVSTTAPALHPQPSTAAAALHPLQAHAAFDYSRCATSTSSTAFDYSDYVAQGACAR